MLFLLWPLLYLTISSYKQHNVKPHLKCDLHVEFVMKSSHKQAVLQVTMQPLLWKHNLHGLFTSIWDYSEIKKSLACPCYCANV